MINYFFSLAIKMPWSKKVFVNETLGIKLLKRPYYESTSIKTKAVYGKSVLLGLICNVRVTYLVEADSLFEYSKGV